MRVVSRDELRSLLTWPGAISALREAHLGGRPILKDLLVQEGAFSLFSRAVVLPGSGAGMKVASIHPPNATEVPPRPIEDAAFLVIDESSKKITAILDGPELTRWKTAADSALASEILSRRDSETLLVLGAGPIALALAEAHHAVRPNLKRIWLWNRTRSKLESHCDELHRLLSLDIEIVTDLDDAVSKADIISAATASIKPLIKGEYLKAGAHVDLVGAFQPSMREADDAVMKRGSIYVDSPDTTLEHSGDLLEPLKTGVISRESILGDLHSLVAAAPPIRSRGDITVFKNVGGAHLDLIVARHALQIMA